MIFASIFCNYWCVHQLENSSNFSTKVLAIFVFLRIILFGHAKHEGCVATPQAESRGRGWFVGKRRRVFLFLRNFQRKRTLAGFACVSRLTTCWRNKIYSLENIYRVLNHRGCIVAEKRSSNSRVEFLSECSRCVRCSQSLLKLNIKCFVFFSLRFKVKYFVTRN